MKNKPIGKVTHYFDKIGVAVVKLSGPLKVGDSIRMETKDGEFKQAVESMQVEHKMIEKAKKGDEVGMKVDQPVKEGNKVYLQS